MQKRLAKHLEAIGMELHGTYIDHDGIARPITKNEKLAREIWRRALGHEQETKNADGSVTHRTFLPDPKAQQFIIERLEGKVVVASDGDKTLTLLDRISQLATSQINSLAEQSIDDDQPDET